MIFMECFKFDTIEEAQTFVDKVNEGENLQDTTTKYCDVEKEYLSMVWNKRLILSIQITYYFFFKTFTGLDPYVRPVVGD